MKKSIVIILSLIALSIFTSVAIKKILFTQNCGGYLKRAADANTIEIAQKELKQALIYMEENNLLYGYTSVLWKTPDEDIEFWHNNIMTSYVELTTLPYKSSSLEKSNMLIKLRETLIDNGENGSYVTMPHGISRFPNNLLWGILLWVGVLIALLLIVWGILYITDI